MVTAHTTATESQFVETGTEALADYDLGEDGLRELWQIWDEYSGRHSLTKLVVVPEWFADSEFDARRPFILARVEYDDESSNAVLFTKGKLIDVSFVENQVLSGTDQLTAAEATQPLDISDTNEYVDEEGKIWIPRSQMTVFEQ